MTDQPDCTVKSFEFQALSAAVNYRRALVTAFKPYLSGHVLEVGSGIGQTTAMLLEMTNVGQLTAVEPDATLAAEFRMQHPDISLIEGTARDYRGDGVQAIVSVNVLEHIEKDREELARYHELLKANGGHLCLFVPARQEIYAPIDADFGHFRRFSKEEVRSKLVEAGFELVELHYYNLVGYVLWWLNFCVLKSRTFNPVSVRLFDRLVFPLIHWLEAHVARPPIGQSVFAIARAIAKP